MATDDRAVLPAGEDGCHEAKLANAPLQGVEFLLADPTRIAWVRTQEIDRDLLNRYKNLCDD